MNRPLQRTGALPLGFDADAIVARGRAVIGIEAAALGALQAALDASFVAACRTIHAGRRQLVVTGMGKSGHIARKIAATFASTGTPAIYMHPGEAAHGDLGTLVSGDVLLVVSQSGNTRELLPVLAYAAELELPIIGIAAQADSLLLAEAHVGLCLPAHDEACAVNVAPTTSSAMQLALGDALAMAVMDMRGVSEVRLRALHPGGSIGLRLTLVREIMRGADRMPLVRADAAMPDVITEISSGRYGLAGVTDRDGILVGVITDGDLRRHFDMLQTARAAQVMTSDPKIIPGGMLASEALSFLNAHGITAAFVIDPDDRERPRHPAGIVHMHDLLRFGLA